jgi:glycosyltransferase involved in cell wall biosynthesis
MRILDLGAHDGFVGTWLSKQFPDLALHIDGIEANSQAVEIANRRVREHGLLGTYRRGLAEDAPSLFQPGSFDAVVAFEIIEHVPDVGGFLDVCERMLVPGGRVYLSTPNGTFGEGNNPHHLRVYRAVELYELCRRRGNVHDMLAGHDGVSVISYSPGGNRKPELAIYCGPGWEKWHPSDITTKGLGGSETAAVKLAEALSKFFTVTVYAECDYCAWRQVQFKPHSAFDPLEEREAIIWSRTPHGVDRPNRSEKNYLWMHDTDYGDAVTPERIERFDGVLALSSWHTEFLRSRYPFIESKLVAFGNAITPSYFAGSVDPERPPIALYTSSPDRGLDVVLRMWPKVREILPEAELRFAYASVYHKVAEQNPQVAAFRNKVYELAQQPGVVDLGSLTQPQVAKQMDQAAVWLAPSVNTNIGVPFMETYCIGAQEAAAGGAVVVAAEWGALPERMEDCTWSIGIANSQWDTEEYEEEWVRAIVQGMQVTDRQRSNIALTTTWDMRAAHIKALIDSGVPTTV